MSDDLIDRAQVRAKEISSSVGKSNMGIDLELLAEILNELRVISGRKPRPVEVPRAWLRWFERFERWISYEAK